MKKSVLLMAGLLTVALAGSAQAAPMFAVQDAGTNDKFTVDAAGVVNAEGQVLHTGGKFAISLTNVPPQDGTGVTITGPAGTFHQASQGNVGAASQFIAQHATSPATAGGSDYSPALSPNFSFYRINRSDAGVYSLPRAEDFLGYFNFGTINTALSPNAGGSRKNIMSFGVKAEKAMTSVTDTSTYLFFANTVVGGPQIEKMRLSSAGNLGIGTTTPTSKLSIGGLPICSSNANCKIAPCNLTAGAVYIKGTDGTTCTSGSATPGAPTDGSLAIVY